MSDGSGTQQKGKNAFFALTRVGTGEKGFVKDSTKPCRIRCEVFGRVMGQEFFPKAACLINTGNEVRIMKRQGIFGVFVALALMAGCNRGGEPGEQAREGPGAKAIKVGVVLELSGNVATYGEEGLNGLKLALEKINSERKAAGKKIIELVVLDNKSEGIETANSVNQLIQVNKVLAIIGAVASTNSLAGAKVAQEAHVPMMSPASTNVAVTETGEYISRICFIDPFQGEVLAKFAAQELGRNKAVIITDKASDYSLGLRDAFLKTFEELGGKVVGEESFSQGDADYSALVSSVKSYDPDVIFIPAYYGDVGPMLKQAKDAWKGIVKIGGDGWDSPSLLELGGAAVFGTFISTHFAADDPSKKIQDFVKSYEERFGARPGSMAGLGYDSALVLASAIDRVEGELTRDKLKDAINSTTNVEGITGNISLNKERNAVKDAVIMEVTPQGFRYKTTISP